LLSRGGLRSSESQNAGRHNILNSLAAAGVAFELEIPFEAVTRGLAMIERHTAWFSI
jgi:UDP-N-acetylmuramyl tripeptide synthase